MEPSLTLHAPTVSTISFFFFFCLVHLFLLKCSFLASLSPIKVSVLCFEELLLPYIGMLPHKTVSKMCLLDMILLPTEMLHLYS